MSSYTEAILRRHSSITRGLGRFVYARNHAKFGFGQWKLTSVVVVIARGWKKDNGKSNASLHNRLTDGVKTIRRIYFIILRTHKKEELLVKPTIFFLPLATLKSYTDGCLEAPKDEFMGLY